VPKVELPFGWDIDRSNNAGKIISQFEEEWRNNSKSWDSQSDKFMNRIEHNMELIRLLTYKIDETKELVDKLINDAPPPPKE
jgi:transcription termination factor NusB